MSTVWNVEVGEFRSTVVLEYKFATVLGISNIHYLVLEFQSE